MYMKIERTRISTLQPASLVAWVDAHAAEQQRTRTEIIRMALEAYRTATLPHMPHNYSVGTDTVATVTDAQPPSTPRSQ
jgi:metal-responsive CopG/Arc/MetJ family transcriptional regulator